MRSHVPASGKQVDEEALRNALGTMSLDNVVVQDECCTQGSLKQAFRSCRVVCWCSCGEVQTPFHLHQGMLWSRFVAACGRSHEREKI